MVSHRGHTSTFIGYRFIEMVRWAMGAQRTEEIIDRVCRG